MDGELGYARERSGTTPSQFEVQIEELFRLFERDNDAKVLSKLLGLIEMSQRPPIEYVEPRLPLQGLGRLSSRDRRISRIAETASIVDYINKVMLPTLMSLEKAFSSANVRKVLMKYGVKKGEIDDIRKTLNKTIGEIMLIKASAIKSNPKTTTKLLQEKIKKLGRVRNSILAATKSYLEEAKLTESEKLATDFGYVSVPGLVYEAYLRLGGKATKELEEKFKGSAALDFAKSLVVPSIVDVAIQSSLTGVPEAMWLVAIVALPLEIPYEKFFAKGALSSGGRRAMVRVSDLIEAGARAGEVEVTPARFRSLQERIERAVTPEMEERNIEQGTNLMGERDFRLVVKNDKGEVVWNRTYKRNELLRKAKELARGAVKRNLEKIVEMLSDEGNAILRDLYLANVYLLRGYGFSKEAAEVLSLMVMAYEGLGGAGHALRVAKFYSTNPKEYVGMLLHDIGKIFSDYRIHLGKHPDIHKLKTKGVTYTNYVLLTPVTRNGHVVAGNEIANPEFLRKLGFNENDIRLLLDDVEVRGFINEHHARLYEDLGGRGVTRPEVTMFDTLDALLAPRLYKEKLKSIGECIAIALSDMFPRVKGKPVDEILDIFSRVIVKFGEELGMDIPQEVIEGEIRRKLRKVIKKAIKREEIDVRSLTKQIEQTLKDSVVYDILQAYRTYASEMVNMFPKVE